MTYILTTYRRQVAPLLGVYEQGTADAGASSTTQLVCTTGLASGARLKSATFPASLFNGKWLYMPGAAADDRSRLIKADAGYDPTNGYLLPDQAWSADPDTLSDRTFEITSLFSGPDLNALVNLALARCLLVVEFTFTVASTLTRRHDLTSSASWLTRPEWVYQVGVLASGESRDQVDPFVRTRYGTVHKDGATVYLEGPTFNTTDTVYVKAVKSAYDHCAAAATPTAFTQSGLSAEADVAVPDPIWVAWAAMVEAEKKLAHLEQAGQATAESMRSRAVAAAMFSHLTAQNFTEPRRTLRPLSYLGTSVGGRSRGARRGSFRW